MSAHHMRKEYVILALSDSWSCDKLATLDIAQPSRHPFHLLATVMRSLHNKGNDFVHELEDEHQQSKHNEENEQAYQNETYTVVELCQ